MVSTLIRYFLVHFLTQLCCAQLLKDPIGPLTPLGSKTRICSILDFGGSPDSDADVGPALTQAFIKCVKTGPGARLVVPSGTYKLKTAVKLAGSSVWAFQLDGLILRDPNFGDGNMIIIENASDFEMFSSNGKGAIQGDGYYNRLHGGTNVPRLLRFVEVTNFSVHWLYLIDAPSYHLVLNDCKNGEIFHLTIRGRDQGGSDGVDVSGSNLHLHDIEVTNRDECISVKSPSSNLLIEDIICNSSGGMSIGSLYKGTAIEYIHMRNIKSYKCQQMIMIKTFPNGDGFLRNCLFEDFWGYETLYAIDIDQYWQKSSTTNERSAVALSNLQFRHFKGSLADGMSRGPISVKASAKTPARNVVFDDILMWDSRHRGMTYKCSNVYGFGYCAKPQGIAKHVGPFAISNMVTSPPEGHILPQKPNWAHEGYGLFSPIPVYDPPALW